MCLQLLLNPSSAVNTYSPCCECLGIQILILILLPTHKKCSATVSSVAVQCRLLTNTLRLSSAEGWAAAAGADPAAPPCERGAEPSSLNQLLKNQVVRCRRATSCKPISVLEAAASGLCATCG